MGEKTFHWTRVFSAPEARYQVVPLREWELTWVQIGADRTQILTTLTALGAKGRPAAAVCPQLFEVYESRALTCKTAKG